MSLLDQAREAPESIVKRPGDEEPGAWVMLRGSVRDALVELADAIAELDAAVRDGLGDAVLDAAVLRALAVLERLRR